MSTVLALRKARLIPLSIVASLTIGLVADKVAQEVSAALFPAENTIGLGDLGKMLYQYVGNSIYVGDLVGDFLIILLVVLFCSALSNLVSGAKLIKSNEKQG